MTSSTCCPECKGIRAHTSEDCACHSTSPTIENWGAHGSKERLKLRVLIEACIKNPSNGNRHEQAIVDFIVETLTQRDQELEEKYTAWVAREHSEGIRIGRIELQKELVDAAKKTQDIKTSSKRKNLLSDMNKCFNCGAVPTYWLLSNPICCPECRQTQPAFSDAEKLYISTGTGEVKINSLSPHE